MTPTPPLPPLLTPDLLARPAQYAARAVARDRLRRALRAIPTGERPPGEDALHDFRVALRRLRTWLRAFQPELGDTVGRGTLKRLHRISRCTGDARDLEVQLLWLARPTVRLGPLAAGAAVALAERLTSKAADSRVRALALVAEELPRAGRKLDRQLRSYEVRVPVDADRGDPPMALALGRLLRKGAAEVRRTLGAVPGPEQALEAHQARLAVKHLRYLLEPLGARFRGGPRAAGRLASLQDALGVVHDHHLLLERVYGEALEPDASPPGRPTRRAYSALYAAVHRSLLSDFGRAMRLGRGGETAAALRTTERIAAALSGEHASVPLPDAPVTSTGTP